MKHSFRWRHPIAVFILSLVFLSFVGLAIWFFPHRIANPLHEDAVHFGRGAPEFTRDIQAKRAPEGFWSVQAPDERSGVWALGYLFAHDRLFQMDMARRMGGGRLSEVFGEDTFELDRLNRSYGYQNIAQQDLGGLGQPKAFFGWFSGRFAV